MINQQIFVFEGTLCSNAGKIYGAHSISHSLGSMKGVGRRDRG